MMDQELRGFLSALKEGQERLTVEVSGLKKGQESLSAKIDGVEKRLSSKMDSLGTRMAFVEKKVQDNEREIFTLKNEYK